MALVPSLRDKQPGGSFQKKTNLRSVFRAAFPILLILGAAPFIGAAQEEGDDFKLSVDVRRVVLTVTVESDGDRFVGGLAKEDFQVFDNGRPQKLTGFSGEDRPATVGLIIDNSRSMRPRRNAVLRASSAFISQRHERDDFFVVHFSDQPVLGLPGGVDFSTDQNEVRNALLRLRPDGRTALFDAVRLGLDHASGGKWEKKALLVISDGGDTASESNFQDLLDHVRRSETLVYTLGVYDKRNPDRSPRDLRKLSSASGGKAFFPKSPKETVEACEQVAEEIRRQYMLVYNPDAPPGPDGYHRVVVRLTSPHLAGAKVRAREGYFEKSAASGE